MTTTKTSLIKDAGIGVFTTRSYKKGEYICFYDCYESEILNISNFTYSIINPFTNMTHIGYREIRNKHGVGQFINDYASFELNIADIGEDNVYRLSSTIINNKIDRYNDISVQHANVSFKPKHKHLFKLYAARDIREGEELYLQYGIPYWISKIQNETDEPFTRLYCLLKNKMIVVKSQSILYNGKLITSEYLFALLRISPNGDIIKLLKLESLTNIQKIKHLISLIQ